jgi:hypothetical protein
VIAVLRAEGSIKDVWVTDDVEAERRYQQPGEELEFRYWNGELVRGAAR